MKHNTGSNAYITPKEEEPGPPSGFIDNTVKVYRMNEDGSQGELLRTMPAFPEGWDKPNEFNKSIKEESEDMGRYEWTELWPQAKARLDTGKHYREVADELEIEQSALYNKMYREGYKQVKADPDPAPEPIQERKAATINQDFEKAFTLGPAEEIMPISTPYGVEIPKQEEQLSQYTPEDNDFQDELPLVQEVKKPGVDLGPIKIQLVATLLAEYRDGMIDADITLGLTRGVLDLQLPEVV